MPWRSTVSEKRTISRISIVLWSQVSVHVVKMMPGPETHQHETSFLYKTDVVNLGTYHRDKLAWMDRKGSGTRMDPAGRYQEQLDHLYS